MLTKLAEVLFAETLRRYVRELPDQQTGWFAGARDVNVGKALTLIHQRPTQAWTLAELAQEAGVSRTVLAERFHHFWLRVGVSGFAVRVVFFIANGPGSSSNRIRGKFQRVSELPTEAIRGKVTSLAVPDAVWPNGSVFSVQKNKARMDNPMKRAYLVIITSLAIAASLGACSAAQDSPGSGGSPPNGSAGTGGAATAGAATAGAATAGAATAGAATAGAATAGAATAGAATGGATTGGATTGGATTGGASGSAGSASGGTATGGSGTGGSSMGTSLSAGCGKMPTIASSMYNNGNPIAITAANRQRRYILSVPANYDNTKPYKLVIAWHQLDGNDKQMYSQNYYWLKDIAEAASSTIFVAPNGEKNGTPCTGTSIAESGCGWPDSSGSNVALGDAVVAQVEENFCIDKNKIFANGWSYGGSMTFRTACSRPLGGTDPWGVRAIAIYNGAESLSSGGCKASKPVAFYASHGTNDTVLSYDGGISMAQTYGKLNSCTWMTPTKATGNHVCTMQMGCTTGYPVEFCSYVGPHTPDPPREGGNRWQPQEVWKFFSQF